MVTIENEELKVSINPIGAELTSICCGSQEYLWQADEEVWAGRAPVVFPICGGLKEDKFRLNGREYTLLKHGFARKMPFTVESQTADSATFLLCSDSQTKKSYPFDFELRISYTLCGGSVKVGYDVTNMSDEKMYFSIGAHEGYSTPEGIEEYDIIFEKEETAGSYILDGNLLEHNTIPVIENTDTLPLKYDYFSVDALVFKDLRSRSATLKNRKTGRGVRVDFDGFDYFLLWTKPGAGYICLEPWCGIQDPVDSDMDITHKEGINVLDRGETFSRTHTINTLK